MKYVRTILTLTMCLFITSSCDKPNVLTQFSKTDTDEALYVDAKKKIDSLEWTAAIDIIQNSMSANFRARADVKQSLAGAYAGRCGLIFLSLFDSLGSSSSSNLFTFFMAAMQGRVVSPGDCNSAQLIIESFGGPSARTSDQNLFMVLLGIAKSGAYLRAHADQDNGGLGDGQRDGGFDVCNATSLPDENVIESMIGFGLVVQNLGSISAQLAGATVSDIDSLMDDCNAAMSIFLGTPTTCDFTDRTFITDNVSYFRSLLNDADSLGMGACSGDPLFRACPCDGI